MNTAAIKSYLENGKACARGALRVVVGAKRRNSPCRLAAMRKITAKMGFDDAAVFAYATKN